jgi:hypothetical protein
MARGRFITNEIARDKKVNDLSDDTSRLAFTWLITFADADGRTYGDPAIILSMLFPRRRDVKIEDMAGYIEEWQAAGLVNWYEANGDLWVEFPNFAKHQMGLRKDREAPSIIPPSGGVVPSYNVATPEVVQSNAGVAPAKIGLIKRLIKGEVKDKDEVEVNATDDGSVTGDLAPLSIAFVNATHIPELTGGPQKWFDALEEMHKAGVSPADITQAVKEMRDRNYSIVSVRSIVNPSISVMSKRQGVNGKKRDYISGEFSDDILH